MPLHTSANFSTKKILFFSGLFLVISVAFWRLHLLKPRQPGPLTVDLYQQFLPWYSYAAVSLKQFELPLWFPYAGAGVPFLATPSTAVFYPPNLLYMLAPAPMAMGLLGIFHLAVAGTGTFFFCRRHKMGGYASVFAAAGYMLSNAIWINYVNPHYLAGVALLPAVFLFGERLYAGPSLRRALLLALILALQFLAGSGQFFLYTLYFLFLYLALRLVLGDDGGSGIRKKVEFCGYFILALVLAVLLCGVQLLPSLQMLGSSVRSEPLTKELVHFPEWYFQWWWPFLNLLYSRWTGLFENLFHQGGLLQVFFLLCALLRVRDRRLHIFIVVFILSVLLSTGYMSPLYRYFALLPGIGQSRQPNRIAAVTAFSIAFLSGVGLDHCLEMVKQQARGRSILKLVVVAALLALVLWLVRSHGELTCLIAGVVMLGIAMFAKRQWAAHLALVLVLLIGMWEIGTRHAPTSSHPFAAPEYLHPNEIQLIEELKSIAGNERVFVEERGVPPRPFSVYRGGIEGLYSVADYHPAISARTKDLIEMTTGVRPVYPDGRIELEASAARPDILNLFSVKYLLLYRKDNILELAGEDSPMYKFRQGLRVFRQFGDFILYENTRAMPRAYVVKKAAVAADAFDALRYVSSASFSPGMAVLEGEGANEVVSMLPQTQVGIDEVTIISLSSGEAVVDVASDEGGLLVLTDSYYPGWRATIDGAGTPIYRANYVFRAVYVPSGRHQVEFSFLPESFVSGLVSSVAGLILVLAGLLFSWRGGRRRRELEGTTPSDVLVSRLCSRA